MKTIDIDIIMEKTKNLLLDKVDLYIVEQILLYLQLSFELGYKQGIKDYNQELTQRLNLTLKSDRR